MVNQPKFCPRAQAPFIPHRVTHYSVWQHVAVLSPVFLRETFSFTVVCDSVCPFVQFQSVALCCVSFSLSLSKPLAVLSNKGLKSLKQ